MKRHDFRDLGRRPVGSPDEAIAAQRAELNREVAEMPGMLDYLARATPLARAALANRPHAAAWEAIRDAEAIVAGRKLNPHARLGQIDRLSFIRSIEDVVARYVAEGFAGYSGVGAHAGR